MIDKQQVAIDKVGEGKNVFITGLGGSGKSWVIDRIMEKYSQDTIICAPTGVAALNVKGQTCHSLFGLPIGLPTEHDKYSLNKNMKALFTSNIIKRIVCDEVGMLRADYLDIINTKLQAIKRNKLPFGGLQMIVVGDFFQLDPIVSDRETQYFYKNYSSAFCFTSKCWDFETIELDKSYRQEDDRQVKILNSIRKKDRHYNLAIRKIIEESKKYDPNEDILHLCCYKKDAAIINDRWYNKVQGSSHTYNAVSYGKWNDPPVEDCIQLKVGCKVIICANDRDKEYVNGDRGTVKILTPTHVLVELMDGRTVHVVKNRWEKFKYSTKGGKLSKDIESTFEQIPLRLGYSITVHKAQGCTLQDVALDFGRGCFTHGQGYVALSRIKDIRNIRLVKPIKTSDIICKQEVKDFYGR